jgi:hypothetical protein
MMQEINLFEKLEAQNESVVEFQIFWQQAQRVSRFNYRHPWEKELEGELWLISHVDLESGLTQAEKK